jgi:hypothetical protein
MMAATRAKKRASGKLLEDLNKNPSNLVKELQKINQKKKVESARKGRALEQTTTKENEESVRKGRALEQMPNSVTAVDELPFADVQPLPTVARGQTKASNDVPEGNIVEKLLEIPKLTVEPGFKNRAPLQLDERAKDLILEALKHPISITTEDLLNVSEPMRQELKKLLIKKRLERKSVSLAAEVEPGGTSTQRPTETISAERLPEATFEVLVEERDGMPKGSVIVSDPVMQYLNTLGPGETPKVVVVAAESHALRTVYPLINRAGSVESLLDPGSQIVSMSRAISIGLGVNWDPDITVQMQSANNTFENTLGLAKNVPFLFGTITVYLQVHVVENAAYKVLLGRPFDIITESIVKNAKDGSQSLTLTDPNTGVRCEMHTHERGKAPSILQGSFKSDF